MNFPIEINLNIITNREEKSIGNDEYKLTKKGYILFPIDQILEIRKTENGSTFGRAIIKKSVFESGQTTITYKLISLSGVN